MRELARALLGLPVIGRMAVAIGTRPDAAARAWSASRAIISASEGEAATAAPNAAGVIRLGARAGPPMPVGPRLAARPAARGEAY